MLNVTGCDYKIGFGLSVAIGVLFCVFKSIWKVGIARARVCVCVCGCVFVCVCGGGVGGRLCVRCRPCVCKCMINKIMRIQGDADDPTELISWYFSCAFITRLPEKVFSNLVPCVIMRRNGSISERTISHGWGGGRRVVI